MKKIFCSLCFLVFFCSASRADISQSLVGKLDSLKPGEKTSVVVFMKDSYGPTILSGSTKDKISALQAVSARTQGDIISFISKRRSEGKAGNHHSFWLFNGLCVSADKDTILELSNRSDVETVIPNFILSLPENPAINAVPLAKTASGTLEANIGQIQAERAWALGFNGTGVDVGIGDTGCNINHQDLSGKIITHEAFDSNGNMIGSAVTDICGHGTHVAGIVAGGNKSGAYIGVAPGASLLIAKIFDDDSTTDPTAHFAQVVAGVEWLISSGAKIVNLSLGGPSDFSSWSTQVDRWTTNLGTLVVCAIGNSGPNASTTLSPGNAENAIGVGAVDSSDNIWDSSSRGPVSGQAYVKPDICAPGVSITSASFETNTTYGVLSGTSMASPHVAGTAALMLSATPTLSVSSIKRILKDDAYQQNSIAYPNYDYGNGRVDAYAAVIAAMKPDTDPPVITHTPVTSGNFNEDITVTANVTDFDPAPTVSVCYRNRLNTWTSVSMSATGSDNYSGTIPAADVISNVNYYIYAVDFSGNKAYSPATAPLTFYTITQASNETLSIIGNTTCPNPFSPAAGAMTLSFYISKASSVSVRIYSTTGQEIKDIPVSANLGYNTLTWDGTNNSGVVVPNGVYLYQMVANSGSGFSCAAKGKIIVLK